MSTGTEDDPAGTPARIVWEDDVPTAPEYDDVYYSRRGAFEETAYIYLRGNGLPERFTHEKEFVLAEIGFGTGLSLVATLEAWASARQPDARLHYVAVEAHPLSAPDLDHVLGTFASERGANPRLEWLASAYPPPTPGIHRATLPELGVTLTVFVQELSDALAPLEKELRARGGASAWYLDGFTPARNPAMWTDDLLALVGRATRVSGTFATFTSAGRVRRGLGEAGFDVVRDPGFGNKRTMLRGVHRGRH